MFTSSENERVGPEFFFGNCNWLHFWCMPVKRTSFPPPRKGDLPNHQRRAGAWCTLTRHPRDTISRMEPPESSSVRSLSASVIRHHSSEVCVHKRLRYRMAPYLNFLVDFSEHWWNDKLSLLSLDLLPCGPDVPQEDLATIRTNGCKSRQIMPF